MVLHSSPGWCLTPYYILPPYIDNNVRNVEIGSTLLEEDMYVLTQSSRGRVGCSRLQHLSHICHQNPQLGCTLSWMFNTGRVMRASVHLLLPPQGPYGLFGRFSSICLNLFSSKRIWNCLYQVCLKNRTSDLSPVYCSRGIFILIVSVIRIINGSTTWKRSTFISTVKSCSGIKNITLLSVMFAHLADYGCTNGKEYLEQNETALALYYFSPLE